MLRRMVAFVSVMLLCMGLCLPALAAQTQYPASQGIVTDLADVLGEGAVSDLNALADKMTKVSLGNIYVITRHFLGGTDAAVYAEKLFEAWNLNSDDVLLLLVIGEDTYAVEVGAAARAALPGDTVTSLLANHFRSAFLNRSYDEAVADVTTQMAQALARAANVNLNTAGLFGTAVIQSTPKPQTSVSTWDSMFSLEDFDDEDWPTDTEWTGRTSFNWRGWVIWALLIYFLFFRKKKRTKYNFDHDPRGRR